MADEVNVESTRFLIIKRYLVQFFNVDRCSAMICVYLLCVNAVCVSECFAYIDYVLMLFVF